MQLTKNLILEGCDRVGKTTLANALQDTDGYKIYKCSAPPKVPWEQQYNFSRLEYLTYIPLLNNGSKMVLDRFMLGEMVYAPLMRGYAADYVRDYETMLKDNTKLVLLTADKQEVERRFDNQFITVDLIPAVLKMFDKQFEMSLIKDKLRIDTTSKNIKEVYNQAKEFLCT